MIAEFYDGNCVKDPCRVEDEMSVLERVDVTLDKQKIGTTLHRQESTTRDIDTVSYVLAISWVRLIVCGSHL